MYVYVCMYACMFMSCIFMYVCMYMYVYVCIQYLYTVVALQVLSVLVRSGNHHLKVYPASLITVVLHTPVYLFMLKILDRILALVNIINLIIINFAGATVLSP